MITITNDTKASAAFLPSQKKDDTDTRKFGSMEKRNTCIES